MVAAEVSVNPVVNQPCQPRRSHGRTWCSRILKSSQAWMRHRRAAQAGESFLFHHRVRFDAKPTE